MSVQWNGAGFGVILTPTGVELDAGIAHLQAEVTGAGDSSIVGIYLGNAIVALYLGDVLTEGATIEPAAFGAHVFLDLYVDGTAVTGTVSDASHGVLYSRSWTQAPPAPVNFPALVIGDTASSVEGWSATGIVPVVEPPPPPPPPPDPNSILSILPADYPADFATFVGDWLPDTSAKITNAAFGVDPMVRAIVRHDDKLYIMAESVGAHGFLETPSAFDAENWVQIPDGKIRTVELPITWGPLIGMQADYSYNTRPVTSRVKDGTGLITTPTNVVNGDGKLMMTSPNADATATLEYPDAAFVWGASAAIVDEDWAALIAEAGDAPAFATAELVNNHGGPALTGPGDAISVSGWSDLGTGRGASKTWSARVFTGALGSYATTTDLAFVGDGAVPMMGRRGQVLIEPDAHAGGVAGVLAQVHEGAPAGTNYLLANISQSIDVTVVDRTESPSPPRYTDNPDPYHVREDIDTTGCMVRYTIFADFDAVDPVDPVDPVLELPDWPYKPPFLGAAVGPSALQLLAR